MQNRKRRKQDSDRKEHLFAQFKKLKQCPAAFNERGSLTFCPQERWPTSMQMPCSAKGTIIGMELYPRHSGAEGSNDALGILVKPSLSRSGHARSAPLFRVPEPSSGRSARHIYYNFLEATGPLEYVQISQYLPKSSVENNT